MLDSPRTMNPIAHAGTVPTPHARLVRRFARGRSRRILAAFLMACLLFGPVAPLVTAQEETMPDENVIDDPGGDPGGGGDNSTTAENTTLQPEFNGNAPNVQAKVVDFGDVNPTTGAFTFSLPIEVPPGIMELAPRVALHYSSDGPADSLLGVGFSLSADDCIERRGRGRQTVDGRWVFGRGVPEFSSTDLFYINGQRLVRCDDQAGGATASCPTGTWRTELNNFEKVEKQPAAVPNGFRVHKRDGTVVDYGYGRLAVGRPGAFDDYTHYCVSRAVKEGNEIAYAYQDFGNGFKPIASIDYGGQGAATHRWRVRFNWVARPADEIRESWASGGLVRVSQRLGSIEVLTLPGLSRVRKYQVTYEAALSPDSNRSRVQSVQEFGRTDADSLPAQTFTYPPAGAHGWTGGSWQYGGPPEAGLNIDNAFVNTGYEFPGQPATNDKQYMLGTYVADLDADGHPDLVRHDDQVHDKVWINRGPAAAIRWTLDSAWSAKFATVPHFFGGTPPNVFDQGVRLIDLNGDSYADIIQGAGVIPPCAAPHNTLPAFYAALYDPATGTYNRSQASGFENFLRDNNITLSLFSRGPCAYPDVAFLDPGTTFTDVNADGLIDLVVARGGYTDPRFPSRTDWIPRREVWINDGTTFVAPPGGRFVFPVDFLLNGYDQWPRHFGVHIADVNGDSLPDIVQVVSRFNGFGGPLAEKVVRVWLHNGTGWTLRTDWAAVINAPPLNADKFNIHEYETLPSFPWVINYPMGSAMLDLNGDGVDDFTRGYCWSTNCSYFVTYLSRANMQWTDDAGYRLINHLVMHSSSLIYSQDWDGAFRFTDIDRDGLVDTVGNGLFATNPGTGQGGQAGFVRINNMRVDRDRITGITNSSGGRVTIVYAAATKVQNPALPVSKIVATSITLHNGRTGGAANGEWTSERLFVYMGGRYDTSRREFAGFRVVSVRSSIDGRLSYRTTWLTNAKTDACHPTEVQHTTVSEFFCPPGPGCFINSAGTDFAPNITPATINQFVVHSFMTNVYPACTADTVGPFFAPVSNTTTRHFNPAQPSLEVMTYARFWYDTYGNHWATETLKQPSDTITYRDVWTQFAPPAPGGPWILDRPCASGSITPQNGANLARQASYSYYDGSNNLCGPVSVGRLTRQTQYAWDGVGLFSGWNYIGQKLFTYTPAGNLASITNERGHTTTIFWDSTLPEILPRAVRDATLQVTEFAYDTFGNLQTTTDPNQTRSEVRYDNLHRPNHAWSSGTNSADPAPDQTIAYLNFGSPTLQRKVVTTKLDATRNTSHESYFDGMDRVYLEIERGGATTLATSHAYNTAGVEWKTTLPYTGTTFDLNRPLVQREFDAIGRLFKVTLPGGYTVNSTFALWDGGADKFFWSTHRYMNGASVERVRHELYDQYDRLRVVTECDQTNCATPMGSTDPAIHHTTYTYDGADNLNEIALSDGTGAAASRYFRWFDGLGRMIASKDPNGSNCADPNPGDINSGCPWRYTYDGSSNLIRSLDPASAAGAGAGTTVEYTYDALDRLVSKELFRGDLGAGYFFEYDMDMCGTGGAYRGRLARETYNSEQTLFTFPPGSPEGPGGASTTSVGGPVSTTRKTYCYDSLGRRSRAETDMFFLWTGSYGPYRFDHGYLNNGATRTVQGPDGEIVTYGFDALARPTSISSNVAGNVVTGVTYDSAGRRDTITFGSGFSVRKEYRITASPVADQRLKRIVTPGTPILDLLFDYDPVGNVRSITDQLTGIPESFDYDRLDRLQNYSSNGQPVRTWGYDSLGNRLTTTITSSAPSGGGGGEPDDPIVIEGGPGTTSPIVIEPVEPTLVSTSYTEFGRAYGGTAGPHAPVCTGPNQADPCSGAVETYSYDANGNLASSYNAVDGSETQYTYDLENRLRSVVKSTGESATYHYGPTGEKTAVSENGFLTILADPTYQVRSGQIVHHYFLGDRRIALREQGQSVKYVVADQVGSTRALVDSTSGTVVKRLDYYPFGETLTDTGAAVCSYRFDGQYHDSTGHYDFVSRHYVPERGVFIQPDSVTPDLYDPQSLNRYAFPNNNPVTLSDPTGHQGEDEDDLIFVGPIIHVTPYDVWYEYDDKWLFAEHRWRLSPAAEFREFFERDSFFNRFPMPQDDKPAFHPPEIPPVSAGGWQVSEYRGAPDLPLEGPGLIDPLDIIATILTGGAKGAVTGVTTLAKTAGIVGGKAAISGTAVRATGQLHHAISRRVFDAIQRHPNLAGRYSYRDPRFVTRAIDLPAHSGYQKWHIALDREVADWIRTNPNATPSQFEAYLKELYRRPDLAARFPHGL